MRTLMAIPLICLALNAAANCPVDHPREQPALPDGATTAKAEMHRAQLAAENYMLQAKTYLDCGLMNRRQYNVLSDQLERVTDSYNEESIKFQMRANMVAKK